MPVSDAIKKVVEVGSASALPKQLIIEAYKDAFNMNLCNTCGNVDLQGAVNSIIKFYNKNLKDMKFKWNSQYEGILLFINGAAVRVGDKCEQSVLEAIFNDPNRSGLVIKIEEKKEEVEQPKKAKK